MAVEVWSVYFLILLQTSDCPFETLYVFLCIFAAVGELLVSQNLIPRKFERTLVLHMRKHSPKKLMELWELMAFLGLEELMANNRIHLTYYSAAQTGREFVVEAILTREILVLKIVLLKTKTIQ